MQMKELQPGLLCTRCIASQLKLPVPDLIKFGSCMEVLDTNINNILKFPYY